ncbi:MAG: ThuA domain-containing protein [Phycisphaeraceae bacterium]
MTTLRSAFAPLLALALCVLTPAAAVADDHPQAEGKKIKVAILTGQNNHGWMMDTPVLKNILDNAGLFDTTIIQTPDANDPDKAQKWAAFNPTFADYHVVVINYNNKIRNGDMLPKRVQDNFETYIADGGKAFSFHAGNNAFQGWDAYEQMIGLLWRGNNYGKRVYFDDQGNKVVEDKGEGPGAGHGRKHSYLVDTRDNDHPVFQGLPDQWMHNVDELYHGQRGPAENMTVLLTAYSDKNTGGTGKHEAVVWTIPFGEGLVMTNVMGHWWKNDKDAPALKCAGFQTIFTRSVEWLATGKVTQPVPDDFPTKDAVSVRELDKFEPLAFIYVPGVPGSDPFAACGCGQHDTRDAFVPASIKLAHLFEPAPAQAPVTR